MRSKSTLRASPLASLIISSHRDFAPRENILFVQNLPMRGSLAKLTFLLSP